jgi:hypothetical protein
MERERRTSVRSQRRMDRGVAGKWGAVREFIVEGNSGRIKRRVLKKRDRDRLEKELKVEGIRGKLLSGV